MEARIIREADSAGVRDTKEVSVTFGVENEIDIEKKRRRTKADVDEVNRSTVLSLSTRRCLFVNHR